MIAKEVKSSLFAAKSLLRQCPAKDSDRLESRMPKQSHDRYLLVAAAIRSVVLGPPNSVDRSIYGPSIHH